MFGVKKAYDQQTEDLRQVDELCGEGNSRNVLERYEGWIGEWGASN